MRRFIFSSLLVAVSLAACSANVDVGGPRLPSDSAGSTTGGDGSTGMAGSTDGGSGMTTGAAGDGGDTSLTGGSGGSPLTGPYAGPFKILVLSKTLDFHHDSIPDCQMLLSTLGQTPDDMMPTGTKPSSQFTVDIANDDLSQFTDDALKSYGMLFWCSPTGPVFSSGGANGVTGMAAIQKYVEGGGAWGGVHAATDFENMNGFPWFTNTLLGCYFESHDSDGTPGTVQVEAPYADHPVMRGVPPTWNTQDEWFYMNRDVSLLPDFQILARLAKDQRPVVWIKELGTANNGRMFYTIRGHNRTVYQEPDFNKLILNGVLWATHRLN